MEAAMIQVDSPLILIIGQQLPELWSNLYLACKTMRFGDGEQPMPFRYSANPQTFGLPQNFSRNKTVLFLGLYNISSKMSLNI